MSRAIIILAIAAAVGATSFTPATAAGKRSDAPVQATGQTNVAHNPYRVHRFKTWCTLSLKPARSNIAFANREARGCYRS